MMLTSLLNLTILYKLSGHSPLFSACYMGHSSIVGELLQHGADVNQRYNDERTALCVSGSLGHVWSILPTLEFLSFHWSRGSNSDAGKWITLGRVEVALVTTGVTLYTRGIHQRNHSPFSPFPGSLL